MMEISITVLLNALFPQPVTGRKPVIQNENHFSWECCPPILKNHIQFWIFP